ncbi:MAG TPA: squalene synthase HpnC [Thiobacillaceae bacterium]|nr:squalene synthase HpnC [Thiobacillaceae bacterium]
MVIKSNPLFSQAFFPVSIGHYENFPVASLALPRRLRRPVRAIYTFARSADDLADEGGASPEARLQSLDAYRRELDAIAVAQSPRLDLFKNLSQVILEWKLPLEPFYDLLDAFSEDVVKSRYANFGEVMNYCRRSANPVGRLMLQLFGHAEPRNIAYSDGICSALQLINFLQDVGIDWKKARSYLPQDELARSGLNDAQLATLLESPPPSSGSAPAPAVLGKGLGGIPLVALEASPERRWREFMLSQIGRARKILQAGAPLGLVLKGREGFELRMIIAGGDRILRKLHADPAVSLKRRPKLNAWDWTIMFFRALTKR